MNNVSSSDQHFGIRDNSENESAKYNQPNKVSIDLLLDVKLAIGGSGTMNFTDVKDTLQVMGLLFSAEVKNISEVPINAVVTKAEIYFNNALTKTLSNSVKETIYPHESSVLQIEPIYFNPSNESILFSELRQMDYRLHLNY